ncbi:hypothetical protein [Nitratireductor sp.]|uniref:hypothetical protein n=1 Tax=Nitratireductor sp. TaxID=1872084 RepID=UPI0025E17829|nr:hypothetical protein [Nitratireductor sp.]
MHVDPGIEQNCLPRLTPAGSQEVETTQYGRRIEVDGTWTVYHVFTGVPALQAEVPAIGLSRIVATDLMIRNNQRQKRPVGLTGKSMRTSVWRSPRSLGAAALKMLSGKTIRH